MHGLAQFQFHLLWPRPSGDGGENDDPASPNAVHIYGAAAVLDHLVWPYCRAIDKDGLAKFRGPLSKVLLCGRARGDKGNRGEQGRAMDHGVFINFQDGLSMNRLRNRATTV